MALINDDETEEVSEVLPVSTAADKFADSEFDGEPVVVEDIEVGPDGEERSRKATENHVIGDEAAAVEDLELAGPPRSSGMTRPTGGTANTTSWPTATEERTAA